MLAGSSRHLEGKTQSGLSSSLRGNRRIATDQNALCFSADILLEVPSLRTFADEDDKAFNLAVPVLLGTVDYGRKFFDVGLS